MSRLLDRIMGLIDDHAEDVADYHRAPAIYRDAALVSRQVVRAEIERMAVVVVAARRIRDECEISEDQGVFRHEIEQGHWDTLNHVLNRLDDRETIPIEDVEDAAYPDDPASAPAETCSDWISLRRRPFPVAGRIWHKATGGYGAHRVGNHGARRQYATVCGKWLSPASVRTSKPGPDDGRLCPVCEAASLPPISGGEHGAGKSHWYCPECDDTWDDDEEGSSACPQCDREVVDDTPTEEEDAYEDFGGSLHIQCYDCNHEWRDHTLTRPCPKCGSLPQEDEGPENETTTSILTAPSDTGEPTHGAGDTVACALCLRPYDGSLDRCQFCAERDRYRLQAAVDADAMWAANGRMRLCAAVEWKPQDLWVGVFWKRTRFDGFHAVDLWICLIPCVPIHLWWYRSTGEEDQEDPADGWAKSR